jgi:hypothetical protein
MKASEKTMAISIVSPIVGMGLVGAGVGGA